MSADFDARPIIITLAGPNGAGKSTFYEAHLAGRGLDFVNADHLARELGVSAYEAADAATQLREALVAEEVSFIFETVLSDPVGDKVACLRKASERGYTVILCFIGIDGPDTSEQRVAMRVAQGGHDVPADKIVARFQRTLENLRLAIAELPHVIVYDNSDLGAPFRKVAEYEAGVLVASFPPRPTWLP